MCLAPQLHTEAPLRRQTIHAGHEVARRGPVAARTRCRRSAPRAAEGAELAGSFIGNSCSGCHSMDESNSTEDSPRRNNNAQETRCYWPGGRSHPLARRLDGADLVRHRSARRRSRPGRRAPQADEAQGQEAHHQEVLQEVLQEADGRSGRRGAEVVISPILPPAVGAKPTRSGRENAMAASSSRTKRSFSFSVAFPRLRRIAAYNGTRGSMGLRGGNSPA